MCFGGTFESVNSTMLSTGLINSTDSIKYFSLILNHFFFIGNGETHIFLHKASDLALLPFDVAVRIEVQNSQILQQTVG